LRGDVYVMAGLEAGRAGDDIHITEAMIGPLVDAVANMDIE